MISLFLNKTNSKVNLKLSTMLKSYHRQTNLTLLNQPLDMGQAVVVGLCRKIKLFSHSQVHKLFHLLIKLVSLKVCIITILFLMEESLV